MRSFALIIVILAAATVLTLPGRAAEDGALADPVAADEPAGVGELAPAAMVAPASKDLPPRLDSRTRDLLAMAGLVCLLLASLLLNANALRRRPRGRVGPSAAARPAPPARTATRGDVVP